MIQKTLDHIEESRNYQNEDANIIKPYVFRKLKGRYQAKFKKGENDSELLEEDSDEDKNFFDMIQG